MDDAFYEWLMDAYNNKELNLPEIENACKDRCGARKLWEEFTFGHDELENAMEVINHVRHGIKWQLAKDKQYNDLNTHTNDNAPDCVDNDLQQVAKAKE